MALTPSASLDGALCSVTLLGGEHSFAALTPDLLTPLGLLMLAGWLSLLIITCRGTMCHGYASVCL